MYMLWFLNLMFSMSFKLFISIYINNNIYVGEHMRSKTDFGQPTAPAIAEKTLKPLSPFIIAVSGREKVLKAERLLDLKNYILLEEKPKIDGGRESLPPVAIASGLFEKGDYVFPLCIVEIPPEPHLALDLLEKTFMDVSETRTRKGDAYVYICIKVFSDAIYVINAGAAIGINGSGKGDSEISVGDIVVATGSCGFVAHNLQSIRNLQEMRGCMHITSSKELYEAARSVVYSSGIRSHFGPNFSAGPLLEQANSVGLDALYDLYGVITVEDKQRLIDLSAAKLRESGVSIETNMIAAIAKIIPEKPALLGEDRRKLVCEAEDNAMLLAALTLHYIAKQKGG